MAIHYQDHCAVINHTEFPQWTVYEYYLLDKFNLVPYINEIYLWRNIRENRNSLETCSWNLYFRTPVTGV
jgi:hypothetical protein